MRERAPVAYPQRVVAQRSGTGAGPRRGARTIASIPPDVRADLDAGRIETASLVEWLAIDLSAFAAAVLPEVGLERHAHSMSTFARERAALGITKRSRALGAEIARVASDARAFERAIERLGTHRADTARGLACYALASRDALDLAAVLQRLRPFAADAHFGVREIAWLAARPRIAADVERALELIAPWSRDSDPNVRRFASESTRPRGVWCEHLARLKEAPELAEPLLEPLRADPSRYVQLSVANWLNDAGKSKPAWVESLCSRWSRASKSEATGSIVKRALRNLR